MTNKKGKDALALARSLKRYSEMKNPVDAYTALHEEWSRTITDILDPVLWDAVPLRSEKEIVRDLRALNKRAHEQSKTVAAFLKAGRV